MTNGQYKEYIFTAFVPVKVLSDKNGCEVLRVRHKKLGKDAVLRCYTQGVNGYTELLGIKCRYLPEVYDSVTTDDGQAVLEEYIDGVTVADELAVSAFGYERAKAVITEVCAGLKVLHDRNIVHRDVKPENVIICSDGRVCLVDLNASRCVKNEGNDTVVMGTVGYASPEQLGIAQSDRRADIYAVGVMLNVMLTGKHPSEVLAEGKARDVIKKCTAVNPGDRYNNVYELVCNL